jgi:hypothetical protein
MTGRARGWVCQALLLGVFLLCVSKQFVAPSVEAHQSIVSEIIRQAGRPSPSKYVSIGNHADDVTDVTRVIKLPFAIQHLFGGIDFVRPKSGDYFSAINAWWVKFVLFI